MLAVDIRNGLAAGMAAAGLGGLPVPGAAAGLRPGNLNRDGSRPTLGITAPDLAGIKGAGVAMGPRPEPNTRRWRPEPGEIAAAKKLEGA